MFVNNYYALGSTKKGQVQFRQEKLDLQKCQIVNKAKAYKPMNGKGAMQHGCVQVHTVSGRLEELHCACRAVVLSAEQLRSLSLLLTSLFAQHLAMSVFISSCLN